MADMAADVSGLPRLPACESCHLRKVRCDNLRPKCTSCAKNGAECLISIPSSGEKISRESIHLLEEKERLLKEAVTRKRRRQSIVRDHPSNESQTSVTERSLGSPRNAVQGSGISFLRALFSDSEWRENNPGLLQTFGKESPIIEATLMPNSLPPANIAKEIIDDYLNRPHIQSPFLLSRDVLQLYERVYLSDTDLSTVASHDLYRIFMILAVGSITGHRNGTFPDHPFGYYLAALQHFDKDFLLHGVNAIQDLLLIARLAIYHHIGTSVWGITQLCIRMCIEQELHLPCIGDQDLLQEHLRRRVFWECYMIDRYSSLTLGRPVAIADQDIEVAFPADADDEELVAANSTNLNLDTFCTDFIPHSPNKMSVFFSCIRLRQITSQINSRLSQKADSANPEPPFLAAGRVYTDLHYILDALDSWLSSTPVFENPKCLYERQEWYEFICDRDKLLAIRHAMDLIPKQNSRPPKQLLELCQSSASKVIAIFAKLFWQQHITYTRSYFQLLFTAGLSIMFCISAATPSGISAPLGLLTQALDSCGDILRFMSTKLPDAGHYTMIFDALHRHTSRKVQRSMQHDKHPQSQPHNNISQPLQPNVTVPNSVSAPLSDFHTMPLPMLDAQENTLLREPMLRDPHFPNQTARFVPAGYQPNDVSSLPHSGLFLGMPNNNETSDDVLHWAFFDNDTLWDMEADLGEYAYGNPALNPAFFDIGEGGTGLQ